RLAAPVWTVHEILLVRIAVTGESVPGEARVALVPELIGKLRTAGYEVVVQTGAGARALSSDHAYRAAGAFLTPNPLEDAAVVLSVQPLEREICEVLRPGTATLSFFPHGPS